MGQKKPSEKSRVFYFIHKALGINNLALLEQTLWVIVNSIS